MLRGRAGSQEYRAAIGPPLGSLPTAMHTVPEAHETELSVPSNGGRSVRHRVPFRCPTNGIGVSPPVKPPTAVQALFDTHETPFKVGLPSHVDSNHEDPISCSDHDVPFHRHTNGAAPASLSEAPTAMHASLDAHDTSWSDVPSPPSSSFQLAPSQRPASAKYPPPEAPTATQLAFERQDTALNSTG